MKRISPWLSILVGLVLSPAWAHRGVAHEVKPNPFQNPANFADVNGDGKVTRADADAITEELRGAGTGAIDLSKRNPSAKPSYFDVNDDRWLTAEDALEVVHLLGFPPARQAVEVAARKTLRDFAAANDHTPHADDLQKQAEHVAAFELVPIERATHVAIQSGDFLSPDTWLMKRVPGKGARVLILPNVKVVLSSVVAAELDTVRVSGTLHFRSDVRSELKAETVVIDTMGELQMGSEASPVGRRNQARLLFTGAGALDRARDPLAIGRGLISHGTVNVFGYPILPYTTLSRFARRGERTLTVRGDLSTWLPGDQLVVMGTKHCGTPCLPQDEPVKIVRIVGNVIHLDRALAYDHDLPTGQSLRATYGEAPPRPGAIQVYVGNYTRTAVFESLNAYPVSARGHVMQMHKPAARFQYASFLNLGRTDKSKPVDVSQLDDDGNLKPGTGLNPQGRYALHFHRTGPDITKGAVYAIGNAVWTSPGWGIVSHDSFAHIDKNVSYDVLGAHFVAEQGTETGTFSENLALTARGFGSHTTNINAAIANEGRDAASGGHGFWFQSPLVQVTRNVSAGSNQWGFALQTYMHAKDKNGLELLVPTAYLEDPSVIPNHKTYLRTTQTPMQVFSDNFVAASFGGMLVGQSNPVAPHVFDRFTVIGGVGGLAFSYSGVADLKDAQLVGIGTGGGFNPDLGSNIRVLNAYIVGFRWGTSYGFRGLGNVVRGGFFANVVDFLIARFLNIDVLFAGRRELTIEGVRYGTFPRALMSAGLVPRHVAAYWRMPLPTDRDLLSVALFMPDQILYFGRQLYVPEQNPGYRYSGTGLLGIDGYSNAEILSRFGMAHSGALLPAGAGRDPEIDGFLVGPKSAMTAPLIFHVANFPYTPGKIAVGYFDPAAQKSIAVIVEVAGLHKGWNLRYVPDAAGKTRPLYIKY